MIANRAKCMFVHFIEVPNQIDKKIPRIFKHNLPHRNEFQTLKLMVYKYVHNTLRMDLEFRQMVPQFSLTLAQLDFVGGGGIFRLAS